MAEEDSPSGDLDATLVTPFIKGVNRDKRRQSVSLSDPYVTSARLRFSVVDGVYRIPTSNPAISDEIVKSNVFNDLLIRKLDDLIKIQKGMLKLLEAAFDDSLSSNIHKDL